MSQTLDTAVIFADRLGKELAPLFQASCPALLPLAGKTPLEFCLDDIATAEFKRVIIVVSRCVEDIRRMVADGDAWGVSVEYVLSRGEENPTSFLKRFSALIDGSFLATRGDVMRHPVMKTVIASANSSNQVVSDDGQNAGIVLTSADAPNLDALAWPLPDIDPSWSALNLPCSLNPLLSLDQFRVANLDCVTQKTQGLVLPGLQIQEGARIGRLSHLPPNVMVNSPVLLGDHSSVHQSCALYGPVVIGDNCFIDKDTQITASVILPDTYIGAGLDIKDAIVGEGQLIHTKDDIAIQIDDPLWVAPMEQRVIASDSSFIEQFIALLLLISSLPLWPVAMLLSTSKNGKRLSKRTVLGNKRGLRGQRLESTCYAWTTNSPLLNKLPGLLSVMSGHLRIFGSHPRTPGEAVYSPLSSLTTQEYTEQPPAGLVSPASLFLASDAPIEEVELFEICFSAERSYRRELECWLRAIRLLFSINSWRARKTA